MDAKENYQSLITEIIQKQMDILGPEIAVRKAQNVAGLKVSENGDVEGLRGDAQIILEKLIDQYISLSGEIVKNILGPVFAKHPEIKLNFR